MLSPYHSSLALRRGVDPRFQYIVPEASHPVISTLNSFLRGWRPYYEFSMGKKLIHELNAWIIASLERPNRRYCDPYIRWCGRVPSVMRVPIPIGKSQILGSETCPFRNPGKHTRTDLFTIMKGERVVWPTTAEENAVRSADLALDGPPDRDECGENLPGLG